MQYAVHRVIDAETLKRKGLEGKKGKLKTNPYSVLVESDVFKQRDGSYIIREHKSFIAEAANAIIPFIQEDGLSIEEYINLIKDHVNGVILDFKNLSEEQTLEVTETFQETFGDNVIVSSFSAEHFAAVKEELNAKTQLLCYTSRKFHRLSLYINKLHIPKSSKFSIDRITTMTPTTSKEMYKHSQNITDIFGPKTKLFIGGVKSTDQLKLIQNTIQINSKVIGCYLDSPIATYNTPF